MSINALREHFCRILVKHSAVETSEVAGKTSTVLNVVAAAAAGLLFPPLIGHALSDSAKQRSDVCDDSAYSQMHSEWFKSGDITVASLGSTAPESMKQNQLSTA